MTISIFIWYWNLVLNRFQKKPYAAPLWIKYTPIGVVILSKKDRRDECQIIYYFRLDCFRSFFFFHFFILFFSLNNDSPKCLYIILNTITHHAGNRLTRARAGAVRFAYAGTLRSHAGPVVVRESYRERIRRRMPSAWTRVDPRESYFIPRRDIGRLKIAESAVRTVCAQHALSWDQSPRTARPAIIFVVGPERAPPGGLRNLAPRPPCGDRPADKNQK